MTKKTAIVWFRQDLRLSDNPALVSALNDGFDIIPVFIRDDVNAGEWARGAASRWWLHQSLTELNKSLGGHMAFRCGDAADIIPQIVKNSGAVAVYWNRCYEPYRIKRDKAIKAALEDNDIDVSTFNGSLLWEPWTILKGDGTPYKVFSPYYKRNCITTAPVPDQPLARPENITYADFSDTGTLNDLNLMPTINWHSDMAAHWSAGEDGAHQRFEDFMQGGLSRYKENRNRPDMNHQVSSLSPHLHFGEISIREVWHSVREYGYARGLEKDTDHYCSELGWREFSYYLLYHNPTLPREPIQKKFAHFPWYTEDNGGDTGDLERWKRGQTGIPIIDAGMRQLWQTGWMHNRVRMIAASILVKNMLWHWHDGEDWFWDTLVDADLANNSASWQWVAGCGADAAPYFRIFNPVLQGKKFDPNGEYVRKYVPELEHFDNKYIHTPWESPNPPANYPAPIVDLKTSRIRALEALKTIKGLNV